MRAHTRVNFDDIDRAAGKGIAVAKKIDEETRGDFSCRSWHPG
jgi:hypothetical protein